MSCKETPCAAMAQLWGLLSGTKPWNGGTGLRVDFMMPDVTFSDVTDHWKPALWSGPFSPLGDNRNLMTYLSSRSWQEVFDNDGFAQCWERGFHDTPHEGLYQGRRNASPFFHLIQDLQGSQKQLSYPEVRAPRYHSVFDEMGLPPWLKNYGEALLSSSGQT